MKKILFILATLIVTLNVVGQKPPEKPRTWVNGEIISNYGDDKSVILGTYPQLILPENRIPELIEITQKADSILKYCVDNKITIEFERSLGTLTNLQSNTNYQEISTATFIYKYEVDKYESEKDNLRCTIKIMVLLKLKPKSFSKEYEFSKECEKELCVKHYRYYQRKRIEYGNKDSFTDVLTIHRDRYYQRLEKYYQELKEYENKADNVNNELDAILNKK